MLARHSRPDVCGRSPEAARFFSAGQLTPVVDRTYPLADAAAAQMRLERSEQFGKIVLEV
jgi:NADPH2:quinone reductase